jgi:anti-anti-sigma factor
VRFASSLAAALLDGLSEQPAVGQGSSQHRCRWYRQVDCQQTVNQGDDMEITERPVPNGVILDIKGDLTYANRERFKTAVELVRQRGCHHLCLNMADVRFIDSSGLGLLALVAQNYKLCQAKVSMVKPQSYVREIMSLASISKLIPVYDNEQDAFVGQQQAA